MRNLEAVVSSTPIKLKQISETVKKCDKVIIEYKLMNKYMCAMCKVQIIMYHEQNKQSSKHVKCN